MIYRYIRALIWATLCVAPLLFASQAAASAADAAPYLEAHVQSPWAVMALLTLGSTPDVSFLQSASGTKAIDLEAPILALTAAHKDPHTYPASDLVQGLKSFYTGGQIGDPTTLNDDLFGVLALVSAGVSTQDDAIAGTSAFIKAHQNQDGGWPFMVGDTSDTNDTAAAIMALIASGASPGDASIVQGIAYLHAAQNTDGGFPYDPKSQWGTASDADSDAYVMLALSASGVDQSSWAAASGTPMSDLLSYQTPAGSFEWQHGTGENILSTSDAVLALSGKTLPVAILPPPQPASSPQPAAPPSSSGGGGTVSGPLSIGFIAPATTTQTGIVSASTTIGVVLGTSTALVGSTTPPAAATTTSEDSSYLLTYDLYYGMRNTAVFELQKKLIAHGMLAIALPTGWFGPLTRKAVEAFQEENEIPPTGFVGVLTRASLNARK